jgi:WD40 repeat protein
LFKDEQTQDAVLKHVIKLNNNETSEILRYKFINLSGTQVSVVGLYGGLKVYSSDGSRLFFNIPSKIKNEDKPYSFQAISEFYEENKYSNLSDDPRLTNEPCQGIICADNYGQVFLVTGNNFCYKSRLLLYNPEFTSLDVICDYKTGIIACAFENGDIFIFKIIINDEKNVNIIAKFINIDNLPCLSLANLYNKNSSSSFFAGGFLNGEIKLFRKNIINGENKYDYYSNISSHLRMINSLSSYKNYLVSCGDDCYINIWKVDEKDEFSIHSNIEVIDKMPVGVEFVYNEKNKISLIGTCFDNPSLMIIENLNI